MRFSTMRFLFTLLFFLCLKFYAQVPGSTSFAFLKSSFSARSMALGGKVVSLYDQDLSLVNENPALLNASMNGQMHFNQSVLPSGIHFSALNYALKTKVGVFAPSVRYVNYGNFTETDEIGNQIGKFTASDMAIGSNYAYSFNDVLHVGASANLIASNIASFTAYGFSVGFGGMLVHPNKLFSAGFSVQNIGWTFKNFTDNNPSMLPIDVTAAASLKLKHAPFRFTLLGKQLNRWNVIYEDPNRKPTFDPLSGDTIPVKNAGFFEILANHAAAHVELLASEKFHFRMGFDYHRREQLKVVERPGLAGFSFGVGLKFKKFNLDYGFMVMNKAGQNHAIAISTQLSNWIK